MQFRLLTSVNQAPKGLLRHAARHAVFGCAWALATIALGGLGISASAQEALYVPYKNSQFWTGIDTLKIGATFTRTSNRPVRVRFFGNEAGWTGNLYLVLPRQAGREVFLFDNHTTRRDWIDLTQYDIQIGDTVIFKYVVLNSPDQPSRLPKYTGPNDNPASPYYSQAASGPNHFAGGAVRNYGHRWAVAGRMRAPNDSIVRFGFEDDVGTGSDMDFDDVVFETTLSIGHPPIDGSLAFTDSIGNNLPSNSVYEPTLGFLYLTYRDDYPNSAPMRTKTLNLKITNPGSTPIDLELPAVAVASINGDAATWRFKVPLAESKLPVSGNQIAEAFIKGMVVAEIPTHDDQDVITGSLTATLQVSYKNVPIDLGVTPCEGPGFIGRTTQCLVATVTNQPLSKFPDDSIAVTLTCTGTSDALTVLARKTSTIGGTSTYLTGAIAKGEGLTNPNDAVITCSTTDEVVATVTDPVYGETATKRYPWTLDTPPTLSVALPSNPGAAITATGEGIDGNRLLVIVTENSRTPNVADVINASVTLNGIESEIVPLTETGPNTNSFTGLFEFEFVVGFATPNDGRLQIPLNIANANNDATLTVTYNFANGTSSTKTITVASLFNAIVKAWVKDANSNGAADQVYFEFTKPVSAMPVGIPVYWNSGTSVPKPAALVSAVPGTDNRVWLADFSANEFAFGKTDSSLGARAVFPSNSVFGGQEPGLQDSLGPVIVGATVKLFDPATALANANASVGRDTIIITLSEKLKVTQPFLTLIKNSVADPNGNCTKAADAKIVQVDGVPRVSADGLTLTYTVTQSGEVTRALPGSCVYLNTDGRYVDIKDNVPASAGSRLQGIEIKPDVEVFRGYPPVVGININTSTGNAALDDLRNRRFQVATNNPEGDGFDSYATRSADQSKLQVKWVPPADWDAATYTGIGKIDQGYLPHMGTPVRTDNQRETPFPANISAVQVVTTTAYVVDVSIYDHLGQHVRNFRQSFGYMGEFSNPDRIAPKGFKSFLIWDLMDKNGYRVGQGAYIWKATFTFADRSQKVQFTRTGVMRYY
jgi:hypothetical protein